MEEKPINERNRHYGGGIVGPAILISLGVVLLLQQFGYIQWTIWEVALRLWPLLIVAVGLELLIGRRSILGSLVTLVLVLALMGGALWLMGVGPISNVVMSGGSVAFARGDSAHTDIRLTPTSGKLDVDGLIADRANGLEAQIRDTAWNRLNKSSDEDIIKGGYQIGVSGPDNIYFPSVGSNAWQIHLASGMPSSLRVTMGAGDMTLHLEQLTLDTLDVKLGAGQVNIYLPEKGVVSIKVDLGTGQVVIHSAKGTVLAVKCTTGVGNCALPNTSGFWNQKYQSPEFESGSEKMSIDINIGAGSATVS
jgi:hypothetical protein